MPVSQRSRCPTAEKEETVHELGEPIIRRLVGQLAIGINRRHPRGKLTA